MRDVWYLLSHKFKSSGLRYEVGISIKAGDIVSYNGPFVCGSFPDITIFRLGIKMNLHRGEMVITDQGYYGDEAVYKVHRATASVKKREITIIRARHETINSILKKWGCLSEIFHHSRKKHCIVFRSVIVMKQILIENGRSPLQVITYRHNVY